MGVQLEFEGIRCFAAPQVARIRPVTLLVGENSSGKTTFLALCQIASFLLRGGIDRDTYPYQAPFNEPPFLLGAFEQIASHRRGQKGKAKSFSIAVRGGDRDAEHSVAADFVSLDGQPFIRRMRFQTGDLVWEKRFGETARQNKVVVTTPRGRGQFDANLMFPRGTAMKEHYATWNSSRDATDLMAIVTEGELADLSHRFAALRDSFGTSTYAFAPIRTSPQRTYDPVSIEPEPGGSHVPMLLAQMTRSGALGGARSVLEELSRFGKSSGLFQEVTVIRKGKKVSDPFQVAVRSGGLAFNLVDVGYGVSQALPIVVDTLRRTRQNELLLLQQPEVHLHPKAQAELGGFFARLASRKRKFVVETHSDYLVDRVRMEVREGGSLKPEDVSLLYFERRTHDAVVHNMTLDKLGQIVDAPDGYRQFFLEEELNLLSP